MNDIARPPLFPSNQFASVEAPQTQSGLRWPDRIAAAANAGLTVASPRSALLVAGVLGQRRAGPTLASTATAAASNATRDRGTGS